ncbi:hypothetical protein EL17_00080 [Anditalea andensis]|uniref:Signal transduction histidine kinase internal region domain-containing protein n=2 Tax=Anditalea andensis TaxID=1048983 RepID=A0A074L622_9BACT|nr:hypothetical protein EL17_00080 [Anditalea andensis]
MKGHSAVDEKTLKVILLLGLFIMVWVMNLVMFRYGFFSLTFFTYSLFNFIVVFIIYYSLSNIFISIRSHLKWIVVFIAFIFLSLFARYVLSLPFSYMVAIYPDDKLLFNSYKTYTINSIYDIFDPYGLLILIYQLIIHLVLFFLASMVLKYTQSLNKISELNVINSQQELDLLKSQIHPHFLFNTLNNLYRLVMNNGHAGEIVLKLSETLRFTLYETNTAFITLDKEIEFLKNYIELEKINHYSNVDLKYNFKDIQNDKILIAPMLFISFVENVLKHGRNESIDKCWIDIKLKQSKHKVFFEISNSVSISSYPSVRKDLSNMRKRLDILYPDKYALEIYDEKSFYKVNLTLNLE